MAACLPVLEPAALRAAGRKHELYGEMLQNILRAILYAETEQEFDFFVADFYNVRVVKPPEHLRFCIIEAFPQRPAQIRVERDQLSVCPCVFHGAVRRASCRFVGQRKRTEMKYPRFIEDGQIKLLESELRVRAGLARKRKFPVAVFVQRDERQRRKNIVGCDNSLCFDSGLAERIGQQFSKRICADLAKQRSFAAKFGDRSEKIRRCAARMGRHRRIAICVSRLCCEVNQKLTERDNIIHIHSSVIAMLHVFSYSAPGAR